LYTHFLMVDQLWIVFLVYLLSHFIHIAYGQQKGNVVHSMLGQRFEIRG
jgi:hypothetical protein